MSVSDLAPLLRYFGAEVKGFCDHIASVAQEYASTGVLLPTKFPVESPTEHVNGETNKDAAANAKQAKPRPEKRTRKPSAFNYYIKFGDTADRKTVEDLKKQGIKPKEGEGEGGQKESYLTLAVDKWNTLTDAERKEYIENHKHEFDDIPAQEDASLLAPAEEAEPSPPEEPAANGAESVEEDLAKKKDKKKKKEKKRKVEAAEPEVVLKAEEPAVGSGDESNEDIKKKKKKKKKDRDSGPPSG